MDDFTDSTKTRYSQGGPKSGPKGAAAVAKATRAFKTGGLVEGVSSRPERIQGGDPAVRAVVERGNRSQTLEGADAGVLGTPSPKRRVRKSIPAPAEPAAERTPLDRKLSVLPSQRGEMRGPSGAGFRREPVVGYKCGGLATPKGKK